MFTLTDLKSFDKLCFYFIREKKNKEQALMAAKVKVAWEEEAEEQITLAEQRQREENQRVLIQRLQELETRQAANNLKVLVSELFAC